MTYASLKPQKQKAQWNFQGSSFDDVPAKVLFAKKYISFCILNRHSLCQGNYLYSWSLNHQCFKDLFIQDLFITIRSSEDLIHLEDCCLHGNTQQINTNSECILPEEICTMEMGYLFLSIQPCIAVRCFSESGIK